MRFAGRGIFIKSYLIISHLWLQFAVFLGKAEPGRSYDCGGYIGMTASSTGTIQSPGFPGNYPNYTRCIWILEAPEEYATHLSVDFVGEMYKGRCSDYVQFRDGGRLGDLIQTSCGTMTSETVRSTGRWMYVSFTSDGFGQEDGLSANYSSVFVGSSINMSVSSPITACRSYEFACGNRLCLSMSYRCDGYNDCGCSYHCDEDGCDGLAISYTAQLAIGLAVGVLVFVMAATVSRCLEKQHFWENNRRTYVSMSQQSCPQGTRDRKAARRDNSPRTSAAQQSADVPSQIITVSQTI